MLSRLSAVVVVFAPIRIPALGSPLELPEKTWAFSAELLGKTAVTKGARPLRKLRCYLQSRVRFPLGRSLMIIRWSVPHVHTTCVRDLKTIHRSLYKQ